MEDKYKSLDKCLKGTFHVLASVWAIPTYTRKIFGVSYDLPSTLVASIYLTAVASSMDIIAISLSREEIAYANIATNALSGLYEWQRKKRAERKKVLERLQSPKASQLHNFRVIEPSPLEKEVEN